MILKYKKGENTVLTTHLDSVDFDCHCQRPECDFTLIDTLLVNALDKVARNFAVIFITSGYRCEKHNHEVGGSPKSQHLLGKAADVKTRLATPQEIKDFAETIVDFAQGGIGLYNFSNGKKFLHLDVRGERARWVYPNGGEN